MADTPDKQNITKAPSAPPSADDANLVIEPVSFSRADTSDQTTRRKISPLTAVLLVTFAILFLVAWFMFSARAVQIIIDPLPDSFALHRRLPTWQV